MNAGHEAALLVRATVDDEIERFAADLHVVEQRAALGRRPIGRQPLALLLEPAEQTAELPFEPFHTLREAAVGGEVVDTPGRLLSEQRIHARGWLDAGRCHPELERPPVDR